MRLKATKNLKRCRTREGFSQQTIADIIAIRVAPTFGCSRELYAKWESAERPIKLHYARAIGEILGQPLSHLFTSAEPGIRFGKELDRV